MATEKFEITIIGDLSLGRYIYENLKNKLRATFHETNLQNLIRKIKEIKRDGYFIVAHLQLNYKANLIKEMISSIEPRFYRSYLFLGAFPSFCINSTFEQNKGFFENFDQNMKEIYDQLGAEFYPISSLLRDINVNNAHQLRTLKYGQSRTKRIWKERIKVSSVLFVMKQLRNYRKILEKDNSLLEPENIIHSDDLW